MSDARKTSTLAAVAQVFRLEYLSAAAPGVLISFFLCAKSTRDISLPVIEGLAVVMLMVFAGLGINAIVDRKIDAKYATFKRRIPDAIEVLGLRAAWALVGGQIALAVVLTIHISLQLQSWLPMVLIAAEAFFGYGYSLPPLQFKVRGVAWHIVAMTLATGFIPAVFSVYTYLGAIPAPILMFIGGFALIQYAWEFGNQSVDYLEDRAEGLRTPAVRLGVRGAMRAALLVLLVGASLEFAACYWLVASRSTSWIGAMGPTGAIGVWAVAVAAMLAGYFIPLRGILKMKAACRREPPEVCVPKLPALCNYARWQASSVLGVVVGTGVLFFARLM